MSGSIQQFLSLLGHGSAGGVTEVSIDPGGFGAQVGYFDNSTLAAKAIAQYDGRANVYLTLNPVNPALIARANNRLIRAKQRTADTDILFDSWFFFDIDPKRPRGISSTQDELNSSIEVAKIVITFLLNAGVPLKSTLTAISGNGAYILIRLVDYAVTLENIELKKRLLNYLSDLFSGNGVEIDRSVYNPSRLIGALGTMKVKGDSIPERPHRRSEIRMIGGVEFDPTLIQSVQAFDLYALAKKFLPEPQQKAQKKSAAAYRGIDFDIRNHTDKLEGYHETARGWAYSRCLSHQGNGDTSLFINLDSGAYGCFQGCTTEQIREAIPVSRSGQSSGAQFNGDSINLNSDAKQSSASKDEPFVRVVRLADVQAEQVKWLWHPYIPKGKLTLIEGDPGVGKSWLTCALAAATAAGKGPSDWTQAEPANVLLLSVEDGLGDTIRPRLDSMQADVKRIFALEGAIVFNDTGLLRLEAEIIELKPLLVVIDPLVAYLGAGVDINRANETRVITARLALIAEKYGCAIVAIRHLTKSSKDRAIYRGIGSIDFTASCRSALLVGCDPEDQSQRAIVHIKSNLTEKGSAIGYEIREGRFYWTGTSKLTEEQILSAISGSSEQTSSQEAEEFLKQALAERERKADEIKKEARSIGISDWQLRKARSRLGIKPKKVGHPGENQYWIWELPIQSEDESLAENAYEDVKREDISHLRANGSDKKFKDSYLAEDESELPFTHLRQADIHLQAKTNLPKTSL